MKTPEPIRILFVEDVPADVELAERALRKEALSFVSTRVDTEDAFLAALATFAPDVIISDYAMPTFDGMRALQLALARDATRPFILLTGSINEETAVSCIKAGATDYVLKERLARLPFAVLDALAERETRLAQERAERALRESEEKHRRIAEITTDYTYAGEVYPDGSNQTTWVAGAFQRITGYTLEEINALPHGFLSIIHADDLAEIRRGRAELSASPSRTIEYRITTKAGAERWLRDYTRAHPDATQPHVTHLLGAVQDVTERKHAEEALRVSEERFRVTVMHSPIVLAQTDRAARYTWIHNPHPDFAPNAVIGKTDLELADNAGTQKLFQLKCQVLETGVSVQTELAFPFSDGDHVYDIVLEPLRDAAGQVIGVTTSAYDITDRKRAEERIRQHARELEAVNRVSTALRAAQTLETMLPRLMDETLDVVGAPAGLIALFDSDLRLLQSMSARGWLAQIDQPNLPETIAGRVFMMGDRYIASEFATDPHLPENVRGHNLAGWGGAGLPIRTADGIIGVLIVSTPLPRELTLSEIGLLESICEIAGNAIHRMLLHEQTHRQLQRLDGLRVIDNALTASLDLRITFEVILDQVMTQLGVSAADVLLNSSGEHMLTYAAGRGFYSNAITRVRVRLGEGLAGRVALERRLMHVPDLRHSHTELAVTQLNAGEQFVAYYAVPLIAKGQLRGVLEAFERTPIQHDREWFNFLQMLGEQAAIAIDNLELFSRLQRSNLELSLAYDSTLEGWSRTLDLRDKEEEGHNQRVAELTVHLARRLGMAETDLLDVRRGALLHDIGMMGIPETILFKPSALDENEWTVMRRHPVWAHELLQPITYLHRAAVIPYNHHEHWDGSGYPRGLQGEAIPLPARIFAVVDAWDALTSDRAYRPAWSRERVLAHLREQSRAQFDPRVVEAFFKIIV